MRGPGSPADRQYGSLLNLPQNAENRDSFAIYTGTMRA